VFCRGDGIGWRREKKEKEGEEKEREGILKASKRGRCNVVPPEGAKVDDGSFRS
jgi:hypothetical protein